MYINDIVKARTLASQHLAQQQRRRSTPLRVGTDVMKMAEQRTQDVPPCFAVLANAGAHQNKFAAPSKAIESMSSSSGKKPPHAGFETKANGMTLKVAFHRDSETGITSLRADIFDESGNIVQSEEIKGDVRITRGDDGEFLFLKGAAALTAGKLTGSDGDFLIRMSGADVTSVKGEVGVINFGRGGYFDGGKAKVTYSGEYSKAVFSGGTGGNLYGIPQKPDGNNDLLSSFENCVINAADTNNMYGGYFTGSIINGGEGDDKFNGVFASGNTVNGNGGSDDFTGFFMNSTLNGGAGRNSFVYTPAGEGDFATRYTDASMQFVNVTIDAGEASRMNAVFDKAEISLGKGAHSITGAFIGSTVTNNESQDTNIVAVYANGTTFKGENGSNKLRVLTGDQVTVELGSGENEVFMGAQKDSPLFGFLGQIVNFSEVRFYDSWHQVKAGGAYAGTGYGTLAGVSVNVTEGKTLLEINTGLEHSIQLYDNTSTDAGEADGLVHAQSEEAQAESKKQEQAPTSATTSFYNYAGQQRRQSRLIVSDYGLDDAAVIVESRYGINRYSQEKNARLGHYKTICLFRSTYDWEA